MYVYMCVSTRGCIIVGIIDPLRADVKEAVRKCQGAGITVRMVTGDNLDTAKAIARQCGILRRGGIAMEGSRLRTLAPRELDAILPRLQVVARSSPEDKVSYLCIYLTIYLTVPIYLSIYPSIYLIYLTVSI